MIHTTNKYELSYFDVNQNTLPKCEANTSLPYSRKTKKLRTKQNNNNNTSMQKSSLTLSVVLLYIIDPWAQTSSANNNITPSPANTRAIPTPLRTLAGAGGGAGRPRIERLDKRRALLCLYSFANQHRCRNHRLLHQKRSFVL